MAKEVIKNASLLLHSVQLASNINSVAFAAEADEVDCTTLASGGNKEYSQGLRTSNLSCDLVLDGVAEPEETLSALVEDETSAAFTVTKSYPPVAGDVSWFTRVVAMSINLKRTLGEIYSGSMKFGNQGRAIRGLVMEAAIGDDFRDATGVSDSTTLPATGSTEKLVAVVHVFRADGTTPELDLIIESDDDDGYPSAVTRITVPTFTEPGSYYVEVSGPITDTEFRVSATVGGTDPEFEYLVAIGIAAF